MQETNTYGNPTMNPEMYAQSMQQGNVRYRDEVAMPPNFNTGIQMAQNQQGKANTQSSGIMARNPKEAPLLELSDRDRLIVKQVVFKEAVSIVIQQEMGDMTYEELIGKLSRLTVDFYKIIVSKNEGL